MLLFLSVNETMNQDVGCYSNYYKLHHSFICMSSDELLTFAHYITKKKIFINLLICHTYTYSYCMNRKYK